MDLWVTDVSFFREFVIDAVAKMCKMYLYTGWGCLREQESLNLDKTLVGGWVKVSMPCEHVVGGPPPT